MSTISSTLDPFRPAESFLHRLDARIKLPLTLGLILTTSLLPMGAWPAYILLLTVNLALAVLSTLGIKFLLRRALLAAPFVLAALPILFTGGQPHLAVFTFGNWNLDISQPGLVRFFSIAIKSWLSVQAAILLAATTPFSQIAVALRAMHLPKLLVGVISLMWRYLFLLVDQTVRLLRARSARSGELPHTTGFHPGGSLGWRARVTGGMAGNLFVRSLERSDRVYAAMLARGYDGEQRTIPTPPIERRDWFILVAGISLLIFIGFIGFLTGA